MQIHPTMLRVVGLLACLLVVKTTVAIVLNYTDYFPANFRTDFLLGRESYFDGAYATAFYTHIVSGPFCLLAGLVLLSHPFRQRYPAWHRRLGRSMVVCVLVLLTPSGLWMSAYAMTGKVAAVGFALLSLVTFVAATLGWRSAVRRDFVQHQRWMQRLYVLLASAVVLRVMGGFAQTTGMDGIYPFAAWVSWLLPLGLLEIYQRRDSR